MISKWFVLAADKSADMVESVSEKLRDQLTNPMDLKRELARAIIELYYDEESATKAEQYFDNVVVRKRVPDDIAEYKLNSEELLVNVIYHSGLLKSKSEARRNWRSHDRS